MKAKNPNRRGKTHHNNINIFVISDCSSVLVIIFLRSWVFVILLRSWVCSRFISNHSSALASLFAIHLFINSLFNWFFCVSSWFFLVIYFLNSRSASFFLCVWFSTHCFCVCNLVAYKFSLCCILVCWIFWVSSVSFSKLHTGILIVFWLVFFTGILQIFVF